MSAASEREIADLDTTLAADGEDIEIFRIVQAGQQQIRVKVKARAFVRNLNYAASELVAQVAQDQFSVVISPSEIIAAGWPGPWTPSPAEPVKTADDRRIPKKGDKVVIKGVAKNVEVPMPIYVDNELVRIELRTKG